MAEARRKGAVRCGEGQGAVSRVAVVGKAALPSLLRERPAVCVRNSDPRLEEWRTRGGRAKKLQALGPQGFRSLGADKIFQTLSSAPGFPFRRGFTSSLLSLSSGRGRWSGHRRHLRDIGCRHQRSVILDGMEILLLYFSVSTTASDIVM